MDTRVYFESLTVELSAVKDRIRNLIRQPILAGRRAMEGECSPISSPKILATFIRGRIRVRDFRKWYFYPDRRFGL
jgi:hypothetical protein